MRSLDLYETFHKLPPIEKSFTHLETSILAGVAPSEDRRSFWPLLVAVSSFPGGELMRCGLPGLWRHCGQ